MRVACEELSLALVLQLCCSDLRGPFGLSSYAKHIVKNPSPSAQRTQQTVGILTERNSKLLSVEIPQTHSNVTSK